MVLDQFIQPLEHFVTSKIAASLKGIFKDFEEENFKLSLLKGEITLKELQIKENVLDGLELPIRPVLGVVECISITIPWMNIRTEPVQIRINGVLLLVASTDEVKLSDVLASEASVEQSILQGFEELSYKTRVALGKDDEKSAWDAIFNAWAERVFAYVFERLELTLVNLHVRFEDDISGAAAYAAGVTLERLEIKSATDQWSYSPFVDLTESPYIRKIVRVDRFSVYWNTSQFLRLSRFGHDTSLKHMRDLIPSAVRTAREHSFILMPTFARVKVSLYRPHYQPTFSKKYKHVRDEKAPHVDIQLKFENPQVSLDHSQYLGVVAFNNYLSITARRKPYLATRPRESVMVNPRAWWKHTITCVLTFVLRRKSTYSWLRIKKRRDVRRMYLERYKAVVVDSHPNKEMVSWLRDLERSLSSDDVMLFRMIAESRYGHLRDSKYSTNVTMMDWVYSTASGWWKTAQEKGEAWWLDREVVGFFRKLGEEYDSIDTRKTTRSNICINVIVEHVGFSLLLDTDKRARVSTTDLSWSSGAKQVATSKNLVTMLALDRFQVEYKTGMSSNPGERHLQLTMHSLSLLASPHPDADLTTIIDEDMGTPQNNEDARLYARKKGPQPPQSAHKRHLKGIEGVVKKDPLLVLTVMSKTSAKTGNQDKVVKARVGRFVVRYDHACLERTLSFFERVSDASVRNPNANAIRTMLSVENSAVNAVRTHQQRERASRQRTEEQQRARRQQQRQQRTQHKHTLSSGASSRSDSIVNNYGYDALGNARQTFAPASRRNPWQTWVTQIRSDIESTLRYGHVAFDADISQCVFVVASVASDLAIDFGRLKCAFVPRVEMQLSEHKRHMICPTPGTSSAEIAHELTEAKSLGQGHLILTLQGIRCVLVSKPRSWYSEVAVMDRHKANPADGAPNFQNSECQLLDGVSVWFDMYVNSDHESDEVPKVAVCGGMSHINAAISSRKLSELLQLIVDSVPNALPEQPVAEETLQPLHRASTDPYTLHGNNGSSDDSVEWEDANGGMGGGPNTSTLERIQEFRSVYDTQRGATSAKEAKDCFSFTSFEIHGAVLAFNQYNSETGHLMEMVNVVVDPITIIVNELRMSLHATVSALGMHVNLFYRPRMTRSRRRAKQDAMSSVECYTLLRVRGDTLGEDGMSCDLKLVDPASPTYMEHQCKIALAVGLLQLNAEPFVYLDFAKRVSVIRHELARWSEPAPTNPYRLTAEQYMEASSSIRPPHHEHEGPAPEKKPTPVVAASGPRLLPASPRVIRSATDTIKETAEGSESDDAHARPISPPPVVGQLGNLFMDVETLQRPIIVPAELEGEKVEESGHAPDSPSQSALSGGITDLAHAAAEVESLMSAAGLSNIARSASRGEDETPEESPAPQRQADGKAGEPDTNPKTQADSPRPKNRAVATARFKRMFGMIKKVAYGFYPPYRTIKANRMIHGHVSVVHVDVNQIKFVMQHRTQEVAVGQLSTVHFDGRYSSNRELIFSVANVAFHDMHNTSHHSTNEVVWTELDEVLRASVIHVHDTINKTHNISVRVTLSQFNMLISQNFLNPFLLWCSNFIPVSAELADSKNKALIQNGGAAEEVAPPPRPLVSVIGSINIEGDLPLCLIYCGKEHNNTYLVTNLGHLRIRTKRSNKGGQLLYSRDKRSTVTSMNRVKLDVSSVSARFARVLNLKEADERQISYHHNARLVFVEQRTLIDTCEYHAFARVEVNEPVLANEMTGNGGKAGAATSQNAENVRDSNNGAGSYGNQRSSAKRRASSPERDEQEVTEGPTTITRISCVVDRINADIADRDVKVISSVITELLMCVPETDLVMYEAPESPTPLRTVRSLGGRRMSVMSFEGSRSRNNSIGDGIGTGSRSSFMNMDPDRQLGMSYQAVEIDFNIQAIEAVFYYQRENEYLRERGHDFCKIIGQSLVVHSQYTSDGNAFLSVELKTLKLTDKRAVRAGEAYLDVFCHDPSPTTDGSPNPAQSSKANTSTTNNARENAHHTFHTDTGGSSSTNTHARMNTWDTPGDSSRTSIATSLGGASASAFEDALKRTPANDSGRTTKSPVVFQKFFSLRLVKRSAMHNLEMVLQKPRFYLNIDFINAFLVYLTPVDSSATRVVNQVYQTSDAKKKATMASDTNDLDTPLSAAYGPLNYLRGITWSAYIEFECKDTEILLLEAVSDINSHAFLAKSDLSVRTSISAGAGLEVNCVSDVCVLSFDLLSQTETELQVVKPVNIRQHIAIDEDYSASLQVTDINICMTYYDVKALVVMLKSVELPDKLVVVTEEAAANKYEESNIKENSWYLTVTQEIESELDEEAKELRERKRKKMAEEKARKESELRKQISQSQVNSRMSSRRNSTTAVTMGDSMEQELMLQQVSNQLTNAGKGKLALTGDFNFSEVFDVSIGTIQILFIDDSNSLYIPVFTLKSSVHGDVRNWSSALDGRARFSLICTYYNARQCIWEPIIEPSYEEDQLGRRFCDIKSDDGTVRIDENPWTVRTEISRITEMNTSLLYVDVVAEKRMNITVTHNMLETWYRVSASLEDDYKLTLMGEMNIKKDATRQSPVRLVNNTGCTITLLQGDVQTPAMSLDDIDVVSTMCQTVRDNDEVDVWLQGDTINELSPFSVLLPKSKKNGRKVDITIEAWSAVTDVDIEMTGEYRYNVMRMADGRISRLIIEVTYSQGAKVVRLRSSALLQNHLEVSLDVSYMTDMGDVSTTIAANSDLALPLDTKVSSTIRVRPDLNHHWCEALNLVLPDVLDVTRDEEGMSRKKNAINISQEDEIEVGGPRLEELDDDDSEEDGRHKSYAQEAKATAKAQRKRRSKRGYSSDTYLRCQKLATNIGTTRSGPEPPFIIVCGRTSNQADEAGYCFSPPVIINNMLPLQFRAHFTERDSLHKHYTDAIEPGGHCSMHVDLSRERNPLFYMKLPRYGTGEQPIRTTHGELARFFEVSSNQQGPLNIGLHWERHGKALQVTVFVQYWLMNKTGLPLVIKQAGLGGDPSRCPPFEAPILFSYAKEKTFTSKAVRISVNGAESGDWSKKFNLDKIGTPQVLHARGRSMLREAGPQVGKGPAISEEEVLRDHQFGLSVEFGPIQLTKIVTLKPHLLIVNNSHTKLRMANKYCLKTDNLEIRKGDAKPFYWSTDSRPAFPLSSANRQVCVRGMVTGDDEDHDDDPDEDFFVQSDTAWSPPFEIDQPGNFIIKLGQPLLDEDDPHMDKRKPDGFRMRVLRVTVTLNGATITVVLRDDYYQDAVRLENHCQSIIEVREEKSKERIVIRPGRAVPYCYDNPVAKPVLQWRVLRTKKWVTVDMGLVKREFTMHKEGDRERILQSIPFPDGPTRILVITDQTRMINTILDSFASSISSATESTAPTFELHLNCVGMGVSFVASKPMEIIYMQLDGVFVDYVQSIKGYEMVGRLQHFQIDNQLPTTPFPVLLTMTTVPGVAPNDPNNPLIYVKVIKSFTEEANLQVYPYVALKIRPLSIQLEENILLELMNFTATDPLDNVLVSRPIERMGEAIRSCVKPLMAAEVSDQMSQSVYLDQFYIAPVKAALSFTLSGDDGQENQDNSSPVIILLRSIGGSVSNITRAPIMLKSVEVTQTMTTTNLFANQIGRHYRRVGLQQIYKVFGSVELLGNPVATVNEVAFGFTSFGSQISKGAKSGHLNYGIAGGFRTLGAYSLSGVLGAFVRITMSFGNLVSLATFDKEYLDARRRRTKNLSNSPSDNFYVGGYLFVQGVLVGVCGVIVKPIKGGLQYGAQGAAKGLAKGAIGFFVRPFLAVFDIFTYSMNGIVTLATSGRFKGRVRPPRYIDTDRIVRPFDIHSSTGANMLAWMRNGKHLHEEYVNHVDLSAYTQVDHHPVVLVTRRFLFLVNQLAGKTFVKKQVRLSEIEGRAVSARGIELHLKETDAHGMEMVLIKTYARDDVRTTLLDLFDEMGIKDTAGWLGAYIRPRTSLSNSSENSSRSGYSPQFDDDTQYELRPKNSNQSNLAKRDSDQSIPSDGTDSRKNHNAFEFTDTKRGSLDVSSDLFDVGTDSKGKGASADSAQPPTAAPNYTTAAPAPDYEDAQLLHFASPRTSLPSEFTTTDDNEFGQYDDMDRLRKDAMRDLIGSATDDSESDSEVDTQGTLDEQHTGTSTRPLDTSLEKSSDFFEEEDTVSTAASDGSTWAALGEPYVGVSQSKSALGVTLYRWRASNVDTPTGSLTAHSAGALGNGRPRAESLRPARVPSRRTSKPTIGYSQSVQGRRGAAPAPVVNLPPSAMKQGNRTRQGRGPRITVSFGDLPFGAGERRRNLSSPPPSR